MNLDGIRVLDLTQLLPGPYATQLLADMGADVVKVEPPTGDPARHVQAEPGWAGHVFSAVNSGKRSVVVDLKQTAGREAFYELVAESDVVFEQFRPGTAERLGIDYESLVDHREALVYCSLSGYGQAGPYADRVGHDLNYVGVAGLLDMTRPDGTETGTEGASSDGTGEPVPVGYPVADMSGGLVAVTGILGALLQRELGGGGANLDVSMTDAVCSLGGVELAMADSGLDPRPGDTPMSGAVPWYDVYETADGHHVTLAALEPRFFEAFCETVDRPELFELHLTSDPEQRRQLRAELTELFATHDREEWTEMLGTEAMFGPVNTPEETLADPHLRERGLFVDTDAGHRRVRAPIFDRTERTTEFGTGVPSLGEHTDEVLAECGFDAEEREQLQESGAVN